MHSPTLQVFIHVLTINCTGTSLLSYEEAKKLAVFTACEEGPQLGL